MKFRTLSWTRYQPLINNEFRVNRVGWRPSTNVRTAADRTMGIDDDVPTRLISSLPSSSLSPADVRVLSSVTSVSYVNRSSHKHGQYSLGSLQPSMSLVPPCRSFQRRFLADGGGDQRALADLLKKHKVFEFGVHEPKAAGRLFHGLQVITNSNDGSLGRTLQNSMIEELRDANMLELDEMYSLIAGCTSSDVANDIQSENCYDKIHVLSESSGDSPLDAFKTDYFQLVILPDGFSDDGLLTSMPAGLIADEVSRIVQPGGYVAVLSSDNDLDSALSTHQGLDLIEKLLEDNVSLYQLK